MAKHREEKPTANIVIKQRDHLKGVWRMAHNKWNDIDQFYNLEFNLWPTGIDRPEYHSPRARSIIDNAVDSQLSGTPSPHRPPSRQTEAAKIKADKVEEWLQNALTETALLEPQPTWKQVSKNLLLYGYTVIEGPTLTFEDRPEKPEDEDFDDDEDFDRAMAVWKNDNKEWLPFRLRAPHPARVLLDPTSKKPKQAIKVMKRYADDLVMIMEAADDRDAAVDTFEMKDGNPWELVDCTEYWTKEWHALLIRDKLMIVEENTWGFLPFTHCFSGFGQEKTNSPNGIQPENMAVGMIEFLRDSLLIQSQALSGRHNALLEASFQIWGTPKSANEIANHLRQGDIVPGIQKNDLFKIDIPNLQQWMFQAIQELDDDLEASTFSKQLSGRRERGVSTVGQQAILSTAAAKKFVELQKQIEGMASITGSRFLQLLDVVIDEEITINGHSLAPKDLDHDFSVKVKFEVVDPVLELQRRQLGIQEVDKGLKSFETYWAVDAKLEDATGEKRRLLKEMVERSPEVVNILAQAAAKELGLDSLLESLNEEGGEEGGALSGILGPDGQSLPSTMGSGGGDAGLRQPLTGTVPKPAPLPRTAAGAL